MKIEKTIIVWALLAMAAYFVQKATVNYTFDYSIISRPLLENRYQHLLSVLPSIGKAVYVTDLDPSPSAAAARKEERLARYLLAPYLAKDGQSPFVVTDFHHPVDLKEWALDHQLFLVQNFYDGVALFRKKNLP